MNASVENLRMNEYESRPSLRRRSHASISDFPPPQAPVCFNPTRQNTIEQLKTLLLNSLPHLAILALFLVYSLIGAAIFKEIETDNLIPSSSSSASMRFNSKMDLVKNVKRQEFQLNINQLFKDHRKKVNGNLNKLMVKYNHATVIYNHSTHRPADDKETLEFIEKLNIKSPSIKRQASSQLNEFMAKSKLDFQRSLKMVIDEFNSEQSSFEKAAYDILNKQDVNLNSMASNADNEAIMTDEECTEDACVDKKSENKKFLTSFHFIIATLTSIGYRGIIPHTIIGKLFTMVYLIIGLPLTLILLSDIGKLLTRYLNFVATMYTILCIDIYYDQILKYLEKSRIRSASFIFRLCFLRFKRPKTQSHNQKLIAEYDTLTRCISHKPTVDANNNNLAHNNNKETEVTSGKSIVQLMNEIITKSLQNSDATFNFSLTFLTVMIFIYLTIGVLLSTRITDHSIFDRYYFSMLTLTKIDTGDMTIKKNTHMIAAFIYILIGMSLFSLTIKYLQEHIREILLKNGQTIIAELIKFINQFGYNLTSDDFNLTLSSDSALILEANQKLKVEKNNKLKRKHDQATVKCDKQTQITTLLYSKVNYDNKLMTVESSLEETPVVKQMPVKLKKYTFESAKSNFSSTPSKFSSFNVKT